MDKLNAENLYLIALAELEAALGLNSAERAETACETVNLTLAQLDGTGLDRELLLRVEDTMVVHGIQALRVGSDCTALEVCLTKLTACPNREYMSRLLELSGTQNPAAWLMDHGASLLESTPAQWRLAVGAGLINACSRAKAFDAMDMLRDVLLRGVA